VAVSKSIPAPRAFEADEQQLRAIDHGQGPMLVVAGAGTGKTTVLTRRIARLIREGHARPEEILAVTYTNNAAREMKERVQRDLAGMDLSGLRLVTFHKYCDDLLHKCGREFGVLDDKDLWIFLRKRIRELKLDHFSHAASVSKFLDDLLDFMRRCQDELVGPEKYADYVTRLERGELPVPRVTKSKDADAILDSEVIARCREIANIFTTVEGMLREQNLGTFGHMITKAHDLLHDDYRLLADEQMLTRYILIDEFQDANFAQVKILKNLAGPERNVFAVGDPDQAIYRFRGASSAAFKLFQNQFPAASLVVLGKNRRSTTPILQCAFALVNENPSVTVKDGSLSYQRTALTSAREEEAQREGEALQSARVETVLLTDREGEAFDLAETLKRRKKQLGAKWEDFAVLYRSHFHRDELAAELVEQRIPFSIENMDVLDTPQVRDLLACMGAVVSSSDGASLFRVAALPQFAIDPKELRVAMKALPRDTPASGFATVLGDVPGGKAILETLEQLRAEIARKKPKAQHSLEIIVKGFALPRSGPLEAVLKFAGDWEKKPVTESGELGEFQQYLEYFREARGSICLAAQEENAVHLMTAHTAKGLEWKHVFILRANSSSFPCSYREALVEFPRELRDPESAAEGDNKELHQQEERRLFYVAMTRARDTLTIYAKKGTGKKDDTPPGLLRDLLKNTWLKDWLTRRDPKPRQTEIFAAAAPPVVGSRTTEWLDMPPMMDLSERLSASAVQRYETCPLQFKLEREWRIPSEVPGAMQYGAAMHLVLKSYYESVRAGRELSEDRLIELFQIDIHNAGIQDHYQLELYERQGISQLKAFLEACRVGAVPEVAHVEEWFDVRVGGTLITGRIDRMDRSPDGRIVITDYKTGKPRSQEDADESLQLSIYALAAREKWGYQIDRLAFYNLDGNSSMVTVRSDLQLLEARLKVESVAEQIASGDFRAKPGFHCSFCAYRNLCPATEKRVG
jgi:DNA helicase-2/ATP-dependent DNA helicase PcrA